MFRCSLNFVDRLDPLSFSFFVFVIVALSSNHTRLDFSLSCSGSCAVGFPHGACIVSHCRVASRCFLYLLVCLRRVASRSSLSVLVGWPHKDLLSIFQFLSGGLTRTYSCFLLLMESGFRCTSQCFGALLRSPIRSVLVVSCCLRLSYMFRLTVSELGTGY